jgi:hypothetical protein
MQAVKAMRHAGRQRTRRVETKSKEVDRSDGCHVDGPFTSRLL